MDAAKAFAESAAGTVSFAVVDGEAGVRGYDPDNAFSSASSSKAILLAAELRRLRDERAPLDDATRSLLEPMITYSDNDAASAVYARVGDTGMTEVAQRAGMRSFSVDPGYWGGAQVTAADLGRFYFGLDRNLVGPHEAYAKRLLAGITSSQRWGIPEGAGHRWDVYFKGGWRPSGTEGTTGPVTHQAALLEHDSGRRVGDRRPDRPLPRLDQLRGDRGRHRAAPGRAARDAVVDRALTRAAALAGALRTGTRIGSAA